MAAMWGAIARVREVVTTRTGGAVRFAGGGPEGRDRARAVAPAGRARRRSRSRSRARRRRRRALEGRRVVVADDDPGVTWFISRFAPHRRAASSTKRSTARPRSISRCAPRPTSSSATSSCRRSTASRSRARIKRDVALRDTPVILLSWKEDLLQRVRELGASAAAYLRKESDARAILARVREVLVAARARRSAPRRARAKCAGASTGSPCARSSSSWRAQRPDARVSVRDASFLYEVEIRDGAPRRATRTASDGDFARGPKVLARAPRRDGGPLRRRARDAGRAPVGSSRARSRTSSRSTSPAARGAIAVTTGPQATRVARLQLDDDVLDHYLRATPEPARSLIVRMSKGASPRALFSKVKSCRVCSMTSSPISPRAARRRRDGRRGPRRARARDRGRRSQCFAERPRATRRRSRRIARA